MPRRTQSPSPSNSSSSSTESDSGPSIAFPKSLPDLRFEQSYLATIRSFVQEFDEDQEIEAKEKRFQEGNVKHSSGEKGKRIIKGKGKGKQEEKDDDGLGEKDDQGRGEEEEEEKVPKVMETRNRKGEPELWVGGLRIQWAPLLWVTFRDQLLSPLVQGAVWGLVGVSIAQFRSYYIAQRKLTEQIKSQRTSSVKTTGNVGRGLAGMLGLNGGRR